ncbi:hypothetical protein HPB50_012865 [Hyalomma asiaticum]|uniref:Uncharacterized protein n=1 Tax=Hyalomma asiaticum TaxID=266040 RepID=A0ACB7TGP1_HYAAI|nr:hypothetical protein HPB50_012865 [Hyalomma asiaticum]
MDLEELTILGDKLGLSVDTLRAWLEEQSAREREELAEERNARREQAEREERAREIEPTLAREIAALGERNSLLRMRLLEAQNAARARASVDTKSISFIERGTWQRSDELNEAERSFTSMKQDTS